VCVFVLLADLRQYGCAFKPNLNANCRFFALRLATDNKNEERRLDCREMRKREREWEWNSKQGI